MPNEISNLAIQATCSGEIAMNASLQFHAAASPSMPVPMFGGHTDPTSWMGAALDELDFGVLVVGDDGRLRHANRRARQELSADHPLQLFGGHVRARSSADVAPLHQAVQAALTSGRRRMLTLDAGGEALSVAVVPLGNEQQAHAVMLMLGRRRLGDRCMLQWFASDHGLTPCEQRVLEALSDGHTPAGIAEQMRIGLATVRSHIGSLRAKVGAPSIRALLHQVASLPPMAQRLPN